MKKIVGVIFFMLITIMIFLMIQKYNVKVIKIALIDSGLSEEYKKNLPENVKVVSLTENKKNTKMHADYVLEKLLQQYTGDKQIIIYDIEVSENNNVSATQLNDKLQIVSKLDVDVINLSLGINTDNKELKKYVRYLTECGVIIVAASGNKNGLAANYPARLDEVISVGSIDKNGKISSFSSKKYVDFYALGEYEGIKGTSFSTPIVSGVILNLIDKNNSLSNKKIVEYLKKNGKEYKIYSIID